LDRSRLGTLQNSSFTHFMAELKPIFPHLFRPSIDETWCILHPMRRGFRPLYPLWIYRNRQTPAVQSPHREDFFFLFFFWFSFSNVALVKKDEAYHSCLSPSDRQVRFNSIKASLRINSYALECYRPWLKMHNAHFSFSDSGLFLCCPLSVYLHTAGQSTIGIVGNCNIRI
jgi:hypothetical protein